MESKMVDKYSITSIPFGPAACFPRFIDTVTDVLNARATPRGPEAVLLGKVPEATWSLDDQVWVETYVSHMGKPSRRFMGVAVTVSGRVLWARTDFPLVEGGAAILFLSKNSMRMA